MSKKAVGVTLKLFAAGAALMSGVIMSGAGVQARLQLRMDVFNMISDIGGGFLDSSEESSSDSDDDFEKQKKK